ncbi:MAG TPA: Ig-like domain-containing protein [Mycobacteriales bacterium]|nr:Ig-like domain-containing protein [Mycobacteriales bacterium]
MTPRVAAAAVTGMVAGIAAAPLAYAASTGGGAPSTAGPAPGGDQPRGAAPHDATASASASESASASAQPSYGYGKVRIGVQVKDGSWAPSGTTTAGSTVTVTETGPFADDSAIYNGSFLSNGVCTTDASTVEPGGTATYCTYPLAQVEGVAGNARAGAAASGAQRPHADGDIPSEQQYTVWPGDTLTVTQKTVESNLVIDTVTQVLQPCTADTDFGTCPGSTTVMFNDPGLPPTAVDDDAGSIPSGTAKDVNIITNDTKYGTDPSIAAPYSIVLASQAGHGTASVVSAQQSGAQAAHIGPSVTSGTTFHYQSNAGYAGPDSFTYTLTTPNGSSTATVRIAMVAPPSTSTPVPSPSHAVSSPKRTTAVQPTAVTKPRKPQLAYTGGPSERTLDTGVALIGAGAALSTVVAVRRARNDGS